jgi:flagellar biosynthesis chaperone FliJ
MQTRYTQLVRYKKNEMQKRERELLQTQVELRHSQEMLEQAYELLNQLQTPHSGTISTLLQSRESLSVQRSIIKEENRNVALKTQALESSKAAFQSAMIEYEKFQYLETQQIKNVMKKRSLAEAKYLDEAALQTFIGQKA